MKDYYNSFVELSLQQCITENDYSDGHKISSHNKASKKLLRLQNEIKKNNSIDVLEKLLSHTDDRVRINAALLCLQMNIFENQAITVLKTICSESDNQIISFSAKMILDEYKTKS